MAVTKRKLLERGKHMAEHNLYAYSGNYLMTKPMPGYERQWQDAADEVAIWSEMLAELNHIESDKEG